MILGLFIVLMLDIREIVRWLIIDVGSWTIIPWLAFWFTIARNIDQGEA